MEPTVSQPKEDIMQFIGLKELNPTEQETVQTLSHEYHDKIKRSLHDLQAITVHVKSYQHTGGKKKYSLHIRAQSPKQTFESCHADDWELPTVLHKAFEDIQNQMHHKLHNDVTRPR